MALISAFVFVMDRWHNEGGYVLHSHTFTDTCTHTFACSTFFDWFVASVLIVCGNRVGWLTGWQEASAPALHHRQVHLPGARLRRTGAADCGICVGLAGGPCLGGVSHHGPVSIRAQLFDVRVDCHGYLVGADGGLADRGGAVLPRCREQVRRRSSVRSLP